MSNVNHKRIHVVPFNGNTYKWAIKRENDDKNIDITKTKDEAIEIGKKEAKKVQGELIIHGEDGKIQEAYSYGNDPYPPIG